MELVASADPLENCERGEGTTLDSNTIKLQLCVAGGTANHGQTSLTCSLSYRHIVRKLNSEAAAIFKTGLSPKHFIMTRHTTWVMKTFISNH